jgi:hypothetical protein
MTKHPYNMRIHLAINGFEAAAMVLPPSRPQAMPSLKGEVARASETEGLGSLEKESSTRIPVGH